MISIASSARALVLGAQRRTWTNGSGLRRMYPYYPLLFAGKSASVFHRNSASSTLMLFIHSNS
jgi:hypothetical protein